MSIVEDIRKGFQDFVAPELSGIKENLKGVKESTDSLALTMRLEMTEMEKRLLAAIEASKKEILLTVQVSSLSERLAEVTRERDELKKQRTQ